MAAAVAAVERAGDRAGADRVGDAVLRVAIDLASYGMFAAMLLAGWFGNA